jgi:ADP-ribosyl-[dinitrogen reductase] hydrolase
MDTDSRYLPFRLSGAVWGHLVGDAVGVPYEFRGPGQIGDVEFGARGTHGQPPGTWSDDGALMLALLDSLLRGAAPTPGDTDNAPGARQMADTARQFDAEDQAARFLAWVDLGQYTPAGDGLFDIGGTTARALDRLRAGAPADTAGSTRVDSNGNGSLMRVLPLALVGRDLDTRQLVDWAHRASRITHGRPISQAACALYVLAARELIHSASQPGHGDRGTALTAASKTLRGHYESAGDDERSDLVAALDLIGGWTERHGRGYVVDSFWSAWDAFAGASSYRGAIERAVRYGHDTDTTACIAGGLAGIYWGLEGIPRAWLEGMRGKDIAEPLVARLVESAGRRTSHFHPIRVDWVDLSRVPRMASWPGRLGMTFLPGKRYVGWTGDHWRDLEADARRLREHWEVNALLLLVEDHELDMTGVRDIVETMERHGIEVLRHPVRDLDVPADPVTYRAALDRVRQRVRAGQSVAVACRGGLGRTGTAVGCLLRDGGLSGPDAVRLTREARRNTIERDTQVAFVESWEPSPG